MKFLILIPLIASLSMCQTTSQNASTVLAQTQAFAQSPSGQVALAAVQEAAQLFAPQYAGVAAQAVYSLENSKSPSVPDLTALANAIASATGNKATEAKVSALASAVVSAANSAAASKLSPNVGINAAAATVNSVPAKSAWFRWNLDEFELTPWIRCELLV